MHIPDAVGVCESDDIVQGIELMRRGAQSMPTIQAVKAEVEKESAE